MKIHIIDNSLKNLGKAVLWQYDRAVRLLALMKHMQVLYHCAVEQFWDYWTKKVLSIDTCGAFGCSVWGILLGVPRPTIKDSDGTDRLIATSVYRRVLKGAFYLMKASSSFQDILGYLEIVFGIGGVDNLSKWGVSVSEYGWTTNIKELNDEYQPHIPYSEGDIVWYHAEGDKIGSNWKITRDISISQNTSWEDIEQYRVETRESTNGNSGETLLLKLYDPNGVCRKIGGAPLDALSITVSYNIGNTVVTAEATRRRKCGISLVDNGDMSMEYKKSPFYDEMHRDQKALFEQKLIEFCPFPLGIKSNEPIGNTVFGVHELEYHPSGGVTEYMSGIRYRQGHQIYVRIKEQYNLLMNEGCFCAVTLTADIPPDDGYHNDKLPYCNCIVQERFTSLQAAKEKYPTLDVYEYGHQYNLGDNLIIDYSEVTYPSYSTSKELIVYEIKREVPETNNTFFWQLFGIINKKETWLGSGQSNVLYETYKAYNKGDIFGYDDGTEKLNWMCDNPISATENISFESIKDKLKKTSLGGPFIGGLGSIQKPYLTHRNVIPSIETMNAAQESVVTVIPKNGLVEGLDNGMYVLYRNTSGGNLVVCHAPLDRVPEWIKKVSNFKDFIGVEDPTNENLSIAVSEICRRWGCPVIPYSQGENFIPGVTYSSGDVVKVSGQERVVTKSSSWETEEAFVADTIPQSTACIHEFYPLVFGGNWW